MDEVSLVEALEEAVSWPTDNRLARSRLRELLGQPQPTTKRKVAEAMRTALRAGIQRIEGDFELPHGRVSAQQVRDALVRLLGLGAGMRKASAPDRRSEAGRVLGLRLSDEEWRERGYDTVLLTILAGALMADPAKEPRRQTIHLDRVEMSLALDEDGNLRQREAAFTYHVAESGRYLLPAILQEMEMSKGQAIRDVTGCEEVQSKTQAQGIFNRLLLPSRESGQSGQLSYVADVVAPQPVRKLRANLGFVGQDEGLPLRDFGHLLFDYGYDWGDGPKPSIFLIHTCFPLAHVVIKLRCPAPLSVGAIAGMHTPDPLGPNIQRRFPVSQAPDGAYVGEYRRLNVFQFYMLRWEKARTGSPSPVV